MGLNAIQGKPVPTSCEAPEVENLAVTERWTASKSQRLKYLNPNQFNQPIWNTPMLERCLLAYFAA